MAVSKKAAPATSSKGRTGPKQMTEKQLANLKQWPAGQSGNPAGKPAKIYTVIKKMGFSKTDITTAFSELGFYTTDELKKILDSKKAPAILKVIARAYMNGAESGDTGQIRDMIQYVLGKPTQGLELGGAPNGLPIPINNTPSDIDYTKLSSSVLQVLIDAQIKVK